MWYDFWCMPQGRDRTPAEKIEFSWMLKHVNFIYLGMRVLILLDLSYLAGFGRSLRRGSRCRSRRRMASRRRRTGSSGSRLSRL